jgi:hypothetical protein
MFFCRHACRRLVLAELVLCITGCGLALVWFWETGVCVRPAVTAGGFGLNKNKIKYNKN